jgi:hypothetical protein
MDNYRYDRTGDDMEYFVLYDECEIWTEPISTFEKEITLEVTHDNDT